MRLVTAPPAPLDTKPLASSCNVAPTAGSITGGAFNTSIAVTNDSFNTVKATCTSRPLNVARTSALPGSKP